MENKIKVTNQNKTKVGGTISERRQCNHSKS
jgi:hypothetical protein